MLRLPRLLSAVVLSAAALAVSQIPSGAGPVCGGPEVPLPRVCGADLKSPRISCSLPADVQGGLQQPALYVCESPDGRELKDCRRQRMGLAGFHVMTKTPSAPQWIWSTFEQVDDVTCTHGVPASFHKADCPG